MRLTMRRAARTAAAIATTAALLTTPAAAQLVQNGGFESSIPVPPISFTTYNAGQNFGTWTVGFGSIDLINGYWSAASGTYSVDMDGAQPGSIYQDLLTTPGSTYSLMFSMAGNPNTNNVMGPIKSMRVFWNGLLAGTFTFDITGHNPGAMGWQPIALNSLLATQSVTRLEFQSGTVPGAPGCYCLGAALDDVAVAAEVSTTPEPASLVLMATGLAGIGVVVRRRR